MARDVDIGMKLKLFTEGLKNGLNQADSRIHQFTSKAKREFDSVGKSSKSLFTGRWSLFGGAIAGTALLAAIKQVGEFDDKVRRLATDSNMTTSEMLRMKQQILDTGIKTGVSTDDLTAMSSSAYKTSKNITFVKEEMGFMAKVAQASGASGEEVGDMLGMLQRESGLTGDAFESLVKQLGAFGATKGSRMYLKAFLPEAGDLLRTAKLLAKTGAIKDVGKVLIEGEFTGAPKQVANAYLTMHGRQNLKLIRMLGLKQGASLTEAIQSVFAKIPPSKQTAAFEMLLGRRNVKGLAPMIEDVNALARAEREAAGIDFIGKSTEESKSFGAAMNRLHATFLTMADTGLAPIMTELSDDISKIDPETIKGLAEAFGGFAKVLLAVAKGAGLLVNALTDLPTLLAGTRDEAQRQEMHAARLTDIGKFEAAGAKAKGAGDTDVAKKYYQRALQMAEGAGEEGLRKQIQSILVKMELAPKTEVKVYVAGQEQKPDKVITKSGKQGKVTHPSK
jgi:hypothetical protein